MAKATQTIKKTTSTKRTISIKPKTTSTSKKTKRCPTCGKFMGNNK